MDTQLNDRDIIKAILQSHADYRTTLPDGYTSQVLFDDERGQYLVLDIGWSGDQYLHATPIHLSLVDNKIWVQYDDTEDGVVNDLTAFGVPKDDIVLGFRHPRVRQHTGFAAVSWRRRGDCGIKRRDRPSVGQDHKTNHSKPHNERRNSGFQPTRPAIALCWQ